MRQRSGSCRVAFESPVAQVLSDLQLEEHEASFAFHSIATLEDLMMVSEEQMSELGLKKIGQRNRLKRWIETQLKSDSDPDPLDTALTTLEPSKEIKGESAFVCVRGAGYEDINGFYLPTSSWDGAALFTKKGVWKSCEVEYSIFRCPCTDGVRRWYISIVPQSTHPGTNVDIDFYYSPATLPQDDIPPSKGWVRASEGVSPSPDLEIAAMDWRESKDISPFLQIEDRAANSEDTKDEDSVTKHFATSRRRSSSDESIRDVIVENAGSVGANGLYAACGTWDGVQMYTKKGRYFLFRSNSKGNSKRWYLAIVPENSNPGEPSDIDLYSARCMDDSSIPPDMGWITMDDGLEPAPRVRLARSLHGSDTPEEQPAQPSRMTTFPKPPKPHVHPSPSPRRSPALTPPIPFSPALMGRRVRIEKAGSPEVNGTFEPFGIFDGVVMYVRQGRYKGQEVTFALFRCKTTCSNVKQWFISLVKDSHMLAWNEHDDDMSTNSLRGMDFYSAPAANTKDENPPNDGWVPVGHGLPVAPLVMVWTKVEERSSTPQTISWDQESLEEAKQQGIPKLISYRKLGADESVISAFDDRIDEVPVHPLYDPKDLLDHTRSYLSKVGLGENISNYNPTMVHEPSLGTFM